jgi:(p)ppGpp synthase/HD superfamily hydrolase
MSFVCERPPGYELFFAPLAVELAPNDFERVQFAYISSKYGHLDQVREDGSRYFDHPKSAAWIYVDELGGRDPRTIIDILLHDMSEEAYLLSPYRLSLNFGKEIALDVRALTKLPKGKETTTQYLGRIIARGPETIVAKLCDRLHNLRTLAARDIEKRRAQVDETREYHLRLLIPALRSHGGVWAGYADKLEQKILDAIGKVAV